jgi:hypothetical protein
MKVLCPRCRQKKEYPSIVRDGIEEQVGNMCPECHALAVAECQDRVSAPGTATDDGDRDALNWPASTVSGFFEVREPPSKASVLTPRQAEKMGHGG